MARIVIHIPDSKLSFFMELVKNLGFVKVTKESKMSDRLDIPEAHQKLVMDRFNKVRKNPDKLMDWDEAKKTLKA